MHFVQVIPPTCLLMTTEWYPMWLFLIISSVGFFSKVASLVLSAMRTFPEKHQVRNLFFYNKGIKMLQFCLILWQNDRRTI